MSSFSQSGQFNDVDNTSYIAGVLTITTTQIELKVGASALSGRQTLLIQNTGSNSCYLGPSGVTNSTGIPLAKNQFISLPMGDAISIFAKTSSGTTTLVVQEVG